MICSLKPKVVEVASNGIKFGYPIGALDNGEVIEATPKHPILCRETAIESGPKNGDWVRSMVLYQ